MKKSKKWIFAAVFVIVCIVCGTFIVHRAEEQTRNIIVLSGGWQIQRNEETPVMQPTAEFSDYTFPKIKKGDVITLSRSLAELPYQEGRMVLDTWHAVVNVYLDEELIYTAGQEYADAGKMVGNLRHYILLPQGYQQKRLSIEMICTENDAMSGLLPIGVADSEDVAVYWFNRLFPLLLPALIMLSVGLVVTLAGIMLFSWHNNLYKIVFLGLTLFFVGVYSLCRAQFMGMLIPDPQIYNALEYISLHCLPVTIFSLFLGDRTRIKKAYIRRLYEGAVGVTFLFAVGTTILHMLNICHFSSFLPVFYVLIFAGILIVFMVVFSIMDKDKLAMKLYFVSTIMIMAGAMLAVFAFQLRYTALNEMFHIWKWQEYLFIIFLFFAGALAAIAMILEISRIMYDSMYSSMYKKIAYTDALTGIGNRRSFDEELQLLEKSTKTYSIVCFDLNDLKLFNDTMGHDAGDALLTSFADVLRCACREGEFVYRIGGDEYAAILQDGSQHKTECFMERIHAGIEAANKQSDKIKISAAYGVACQEENESVHKVYKLADERMYEKKAEMKGYR